MTSGANFIDDPRKWRVSKSGFSIRTGWNEDKTIVARYPGEASPLNNNHFEKWLDAAFSICELYNSTLLPESAATASPAAPKEEAETEGCFVRSAAPMNKGICPNCLTEQTWPNDQEVHCMSDANWEAFIDARIEAHKQGVCNPATCASCLQPGDPIDHWLS